MRKGQKLKGRFRTYRHHRALWVLLLLPVLAIAGALAPSVVSVQYEDENAFPPRQRVPHRPVSRARRPLLVPRDYSAGFIPEMVDLERLFTSPRYRVEVTPRLTRLPSFPRSRGDVIVLGDVDRYVADVLFGDALQPGVVADATRIWDSKWMDPYGSSQFDDFTGQEDFGQPLPPIVPEPSTALLVALGLLGLAVRARQRQPATS